MLSKLHFWSKRLGEKLWIRPLLFCLLAVTAAFAAAGADGLGLDFVPKIEHDTVEKLLSIIAASMLGVATFAVASMVSAYASVSSSATPRAFALVLADDMSKTALSTFIAAFMFSVIALIAIKTDYYGRTGLFLIFVMTIGVLAWVVFAFIRWVDQIARLGRLGNTIDRVEAAAEAAIRRRRSAPFLHALPADPEIDPGEPIYSDEIGYVQHIDVPALQACAEKQGLVLTIAALTGTFVGPGRPIAHVIRVDSADKSSDVDPSRVGAAFEIGRSRAFDDDPRFGLVVLSEIAARALSPAVNDPGTAIDILGTFVRLLALWVAPAKEDERDPKIRHDRIRVPALMLDDMFEDAFTAIARDGAGTLEVAIRLQKAFLALATLPHPDMRSVARRHSTLALARAEIAMKLLQDLDRVRLVAGRVA